MTIPGQRRAGRLARFVPDEDRGEDVHGREGKRCRGVKKGGPAPGYRAAPGFQRGVCWKGYDTWPVAVTHANPANGVALALVSHPPAAVLGSTTTS